MRETLFRLLGALTLVVIALVVSSGHFTSPTLGSSVSPGGNWVDAAGVVPHDLSAALVDTSAPGRAVGQGGSSSDNCWQYDSWCQYCNRYSAPDVCKNYAHNGMTTTTSTSSATATPTAAASAPTPTPTPKP